MRLAITPKQLFARFTFAYTQSLSYLPLLFVRLSTMNQPQFFEIQSDNPSKLIDFYKNVFGWRFTKQDGLPVEMWRIETDGIDGALLKRPVKTPPTSHGTNAFLVSMQVDSFDDIATTIKDLGGTIAMEKFAVPGRCWQGYFWDPDDNAFGVFEVDESAK